MKIHVYAVCWNEAKLLPFFIRHYQQFGDKIIFMDNMSTDRSREIIESSDKCYYDSFDTNGEIRDDIYKSLKNNIWKKSRGIADWVIVVDLDEFVYAKNLKNNLRWLKKLKISVINPQGYDMVTEHFNWDSPEQMTSLVKYGCKFQRYSKPCIFDPNKIQEIKYAFGAHSCNPIGKGFQYGTKAMPQLFGFKILLLHYKVLTLEYYINRDRALGQRLSKQNIEMGVGLHYLRPESEFLGDYNDALIKSKQVI